MNFAISMNLLAPQNVKRRMNFMTSKIARRSDALFRIGTCCLGKPRLGMLEAPSDSARRIRTHHRIMQKPHPGEKPSEAFAAGAGRSGASGRKLHVKSIDRSVGDNATKSWPAQGRDVRRYPIVFAVAFSDLYRLLPG